MARETTQAGVLGDLQRLMLAMEANQGELPQMEPFRQELAGLLAQAQEIGQQQAALQVSKQETSKQLRRLLTEGQRLAHVVRTAVKEHYGVREEKVAEFGVQPFRSRKPKPAPADPEQPVKSER